MKRPRRWPELLLLRKRTKRNQAREGRKALRLKRKRRRWLRQNRRAKDDLKRSAYQLRAPTVIALLQRDSHARMVSFIQQLKVAVLREGRTVCIDFRNTNKLYADGTLLLFAEIETLTRHRRGRITCTHSLTPLVNETFKHIGLFDLLSVESRVVPRHQDAVGWRVLRGTNVDMEPAGRTLETLAQDERLAAPLFIGLQEATANVANHAYLAAREDGYGLIETAGWWWLFYRLNREKSRLTVVLCDLGAGIPRTLGRTLHGEDRSQFALALKHVLSVAGLSSAHDGSMIHAAVEAKRSRTGQSWRGKGLGQIRGVINEVGSGKLLVYSNAGGYLLQVAESGRDREISMRYPESIYGTMVSWSVPIQSVTPAEHATPRS